LPPKTDAKGRHVAVAAKSARDRAGANKVTTVTWDVRAFNQGELSAARHREENPDMFLCGLLAEAPADVAAAFLATRNNLRNPPKTNQESADTLAAQGVPSKARREQCAWRTAPPMRSMNHRFRRNAPPFDKLRTGLLTSHLLRFGCNELRATHP
jgi:hypothetical protein